MNNRKIFKNISDSIRNTRLDNNLSHKEIGDIFDISQSHIRNIESGTANISLNTLIKYANTFNLDINSITHQNIQTNNLHKDIKESFKNSSKINDIKILELLYFFRHFSKMEYNTNDNNINYPSLSKRIRKIRKHLSLSKDKLSSLLNISKKSFENIENSNANPSLKTLLEFSNFTGIPLDILLLDSIKNKDHAINFLIDNIFSDLNQKEYHVYSLIAKSFLELKEN